MLLFNVLDLRSALKSGRPYPTSKHNMPDYDSGPVHTTPFLYKNGEKNLRFCQSVHTDPHKNATKTEVFENAVKS